MRIFKTAIQVRFGDTDMLGHVNNAAFVQYLEHARLEWARALHGQGLPRIDFVLAHIDMDYRREIKLGQAVEVELWVTKVGGSSFSFAYRVLADGVVCAEANTVQVCIDPQAMRPRALEPQVRAALEAEIQHA